MKSWRRYISLGVGPLLLLNPMFRTWLNVIYGAAHIVAHANPTHAVFRLAPQKRFGQLIDPFAVGSAADLRHHGFHDPS